MIREFSVSPTPQNGNAKKYMALSFFLAALIIAVSMMLKEYRGIVAVFSLVPLTLALLIYTKYLAPKYYYDVFINDDGVPLFIVRQVTGQRSTTLCRVELSLITSVERENKAERRARKAESDVSRFIYCPTLFPESVIRIKLVGYGQKSEVVIEGNDEFLKTLDEYVNEARKTIGESDE